MAGALTTPNYEPNGFGGPAQDPRYREPPLRIAGDADRWDHREGNEDYSQAGDLYRLMSTEEKGRLVANIVGAMNDVPRAIQVRQIGHCLKADPAYGEGVAKGLGSEPAALLLSRQNSNATGTWLALRGLALADQDTQRRQLKGQILHPPGPVPVHDLSLTHLCHSQKCSLYIQWVAAQATRL